ncbi:MAG: KpsF/GutQ family sugar-phosphate isomerase [Ignavibacteria bacterium]|jgi:arabinose-5-phosphate isomerase|nr:KpsF/GutQ family sugar-phosphate isomerase [Ignavibacteria bacterium]
MNTIEPIIERARAAISVEIEALERVSHSLDANFVAAVRLILSSHKVIVSGVGKSGIIGQKISATLSSTGVTAVYMHPVDALHGDIGMVQSDDVAILLSKSGNTEELVRLIPYLKMRNAKIIAIVGNLTSYLASNADIVLDGSVAIEACPFNLAPTASTTAALALGDALAICLMSERGFTLEDFSRLHPLGQIGRATTLCVKDVLHKPEEVAIGGLGTKFKDALIKMSEKPLGCICVLGSSDELLGILTDGDIRRALQGYSNVLEITLGEIMTAKPVTVGLSAPLVEPLALMENRERQISVLPVVENGKFMGLVRLHDILRK